MAGSVVRKAVSPTSRRSRICLSDVPWEERDRNQASNLAVLTPAAQPLANGTHRVVIYYLYGSTVPGIHVEMKLKTCYSKEIDFTKRNKREKIRTYIKSICYHGGRIPKS
jgi:hypothetical protein